MKAVFKVLEGPVEHERIVIRDGESLTIGRENQADIPVNGDQQMSSIHMTVECKDGRCVITDHNSTNGTFLNERRLDQPAVVNEGDLVQCGVTRFEVESAPAAAAQSPAPGNSTARLPGQAAGGAESPDNQQDSAPPATVAASPAQSAPAPEEEFLQQVRGFLGETAAEVCQRFKLEDLATQPTNGESPGEFGRRLQDSTDAWDDTLKFMAYALPKRLAVWWATQCVRVALPSPPPKDAAVLQATESWVVAPNDKHRRKAMELAQAQECQTAACWAGVSAFWTHGSMAPPEVPAVPPKDDFTGKAASGAVALAAVIGAPEQIPQRKAEFFDLALAIASGENTWLQE